MCIKTGASQFTDVDDEMQATPLIDPQSNLVMPLYGANETSQTRNLASSQAHWLSHAHVATSVGLLFTSVKYTFHGSAAAFSRYQTILNVGWQGASTSDGSIYRKFIDSKSAEVAVINQWKQSIFSVLFNNLNSLINVTVLHIINLTFLLIIYDDHAYSEYWRHWRRMITSNSAMAERPREAWYFFD